MVSVVVFLLLMLSAMSAAAADNTRNIALPGCPTSCGNIAIPYPFGIRPGCFHSAFQLTCNNHKLYLGDNNTIEVIQISNSQVYVNSPIFNMPANADSYSTYWTPLKGGPYGVHRSNSFYVVGCDISAYLTDTETGEVATTCLSVCGSNQSAVEGSRCFSGANGCCSGNLGGYVSSYEIRFDRFHGGVGGRGSGKAFLISKEYPRDLISLDLINGSSVVPLVLDWMIRDQSSCEDAKRNMSTYACRSNNSLCSDYDGGYNCNCGDYYDGNPYISGGCHGVVTVTKLNCSGPCGNISIPYPFGLGTECARDSSFVLFCNKTNDPPLLILKAAYQVTEISVEEGQLLADATHEITTSPAEAIEHFTLSGATNVIDWVMGYMSCGDALKNPSFPCNNSHSVCQDLKNFSDDSTGTYGPAYRCRCALGYQGNPYTAPGCIGAVINKLNCSGPCGNISVPYPFGLGIECARDSAFVLFCNKTNDPPLLILQDGYQVTEISVEKGQLLAEATNEYYTDASVTFEHFTVYGAKIVIDWVMGYMSCGDALKNKSSFPCNNSHSVCQDLKNFSDDSTRTYGPAYRCRCALGYQGNPYTAPGCIDINECNDPEKYKCNGTCINSEGTFECVPSSGSGGFSFDGTKGGSLIGVMLAVGFALLFLSTTFIYRRWKKRTLKRVREKHFRKNRGLLLQQLISSNHDIADRTKIFSFDELAKATNNFDEARVLGRGGHGTVFKGILLDQRVVAIKKSKINVQREIDQFLNEVVILSQINHRNVVKIFGCCLETEVPLLVYEFVSNGTLSDHLHLPGRRSSLSWEDRLSIARDASRALSYLHSAASISIFHRDVKSSNILLDEHNTAKVSDFGSSRSIPLDMTRVVTVVQGTFGYLDPEYYRTGQLTEKSDVYSFGVILVELLTGEKPASFTSPEERNLCMHFLSALRDGRLSQIVEARVMEEAAKEEIDAICKLAETCLRLSGENRPTMKSVEVSLEGLRKSKTTKRHPWREPKDEASSSLLSSTEPQYGNYPAPVSSEVMPSGSKIEEQSMLSLTLER